METLKTLKDLHAPDPRQVNLVVIDPHSERSRPREAADLHAAIASVQLSADVPDILRSRFATAQNLMLYSWFVYGFAPTAELEAYATLEFALALKLNPGNKRRLTLKRLMAKAIDQQLLQDEGVVDIALPHMALEERLSYVRARSEPASDRQKYVKELAASFPSSRNYLAHGSVALWPGNILILSLVAGLINKLYGRPGPT